MFAPRFSITPKILNNIAKTEAARAVIENAALVPRFERQFKQEALIRIAYHTTKLEGNLLPFSEAKKVIEGYGAEAAGRSRDIQEVVNYRKVMEYLDVFPVGAPLTQEVIGKIHTILALKILPQEEAGVYREVKVGERHSRTGKIAFIPVEPQAVPIEMEDFVAWRNGKEILALHPVLRAGIVQAEVTRIHPFTDLNGRVARALATLSLYRDGYDIRKFFSLEEYYDQDAEAYYRAIQTVQRRDDDLTVWLEYFSEGLWVELAKVKERVERISRDVRLKKAVGQIALSERQEKIMEHLSEYGKLERKDFVKIFPQVSDDTVLREISELLEKGVIEKKGKTKASVYKPVPR